MIVPTMSWAYYALVGGVALGTGLLIVGPWAGRIWGTLLRRPIRPPELYIVRLAWFLATAMLLAIPVIAETTPAAAP